MKKLILSATVAFTVLATSNIYAQQGFGTNTPDRSSAVDIVSGKRGLLIPRLNIEDLDKASPVINPANALMVFNEGNKGTPAGFYYWDANFEHTDKTKGRWVRFVSSNSGSAVTVSPGTNVHIDKTPNGHDIDYKVSVKGGTAPNQVLVTKKKGDTFVTEWVNPEEFIIGVNGVTAEKVGDEVHVGLGGDLSKATQIKTTDKNTLAISGLETLVGKDATDGNKFDATTHNIVVMGDNGILKNVSAKDLMEDAIDKGAIDGKALTSTGKSIQIDGAAAATALLKDVNIEVKGGEKAGQVLVTKKEGDKFVTEWVDADKVGVEVTNGIQKITGADGTTKLGLGGALTEDKTSITTTDNNVLAIEGLAHVDKPVTDNNIVIADKDGVLKQTSAKNLIEDAIDKGTDGTEPLKAKTLKGKGITVTAGDVVGTTLEVANSLLKDVTLGIADNAITTNKINDGAVTQDKLYAGSKDGDGNATVAAEGTVPVANADGTVTYKNVSTALGADLTTDGKIVIGDNQSTTNKVENAVLVATQLSIKEGSITSTEILDGTIANIDLGNGAVSADKMTSNTTANGTATPAGEGQIPVADGKGGVTYKEISGETLKGKALESKSIVVTGGTQALLDETTIEIKGGTTAGQVLVTKEVTDSEGKVTYVTEWIDASALGNTVTASNGLTKAGNDIELGGTVDKNTVLAIDNSKGGSLAITGLDSPAKDKTTKVVVVDADGKLATIDKGVGNVTINKEGDVTIGGDNSVVNNYHPSMEEIVIEVTLGATDTNLTLPVVNGTEGQTISIKIVNATEDHNGYLNIKSGSDVLAYGAMPFQGWILKSNGSKWIVVGRN
ncbi:hypothetical protein NWE55_13735 [Myroides albus]|uniref:hypothetical protein n=1 Tax=Myroides albus TaxID=2562892 RepID=UPI0021592A1F|nr:hypothetical protein [Myroides albus]UVD79174.1 hypothetical protein NWE55_13735 [Myroides albus]